MAVVSLTLQVFPNALTQVTVVCTVIDGFCNVGATCSHTLKIFWAKRKSGYVEKFLNWLFMPDAVSRTVDLEDSLAMLSNV